MYEADLNLPRRYKYLLDLRGCNSDMLKAIIKQSPSHRFLVALGYTSVVLRIENGIIEGYNDFAQDYTDNDMYDFTEEDVLPYYSVIENLDL